jgi:Uma2 family endonuclease
MAKTASARLNAEDFARLPNDRFRYEIIAGELYMSPSPKARHQYLLRELSLRLGLYLREHPLGQLYFAPFDVHFGGEDIVQPDLIFIRQERVKALVKDWIYGVPDLLVEVLSPATETRLDRQAKYHLYETRGVADYWLADPERRRWEAYRLSAGKYQLAANLGGDDIFTTPVFPGWELPLASLWMPDSDEPRRGPAAAG